MDTDVKEPQLLQARLMMWTDLSQRDMEEMDEMQSVPDLERLLCTRFPLDLPEPQKGVVLELYVQAVLFARERRFNPEQTSALLSILRSVHQANIGTPLDNMDACFRYFKELLLCHSVRRPPFSIDLFTSQEVNWVFEYVHSGYMRHYKLYRHVFTPQVKLDLSLTYPETTEEEPSDVKDSSMAGSP